MWGCYLLLTGVLWTTQPSGLVEGHHPGPFPTTRPSSACPLIIEQPNVPALGLAGQSTGQPEETWSGPPAGCLLKLRSDALPLWGGEWSHPETTTGLSGAQPCTREAMILSVVVSHASVPSRLTHQEAWLACQGAGCLAHNSWLGGKVSKCLGLDSELLWLSGGLCSCTCHSCLAQCGAQKCLLSQPRIIGLPISRGPETSWVLLGVVYGVTCPPIALT